jgi:hypothetical protein
MTFWESCKSMHSYSGSTNVVFKGGIYVEANYKYFGANISKAKGNSVINLV